MIPQEQLLISVVASLSLCEELNGETLSIALVNDSVVLSGTVHSEQNVRIAYRMALETPGVSQVVNNLKVLQTRSK